MCSHIHALLLPPLTFAHMNLRIQSDPHKVTHTHAHTQTKNIKNTSSNTNMFSNSLRQLQSYKQPNLCRLHPAPMFLSKPASWTLSHNITVTLCSYNTVQKIQQFSFTCVKVIYQSFDPFSFYCIMFPFYIYTQKNKIIRGILKKLQRTHTENTENTYSFKQHQQTK